MQGRGFRCRGRALGWVRRSVSGLYTEYSASLCVCQSLSHVQLSATPWSPPGSSVHGILQARILEWFAISSSRKMPLQLTERMCLQLLQSFPPLFFIMRLFQVLYSHAKSEDICDLGNISYSALETHCLLGWKFTNRIHF